MSEFYTADDILFIIIKKTISIFWIYITYCNMFSSYIKKEITFDTIQIITTIFILNIVESYSHIRILMNSICNIKLDHIQIYRNNIVFSHAIITGVITMYILFISITFNYTVQIFNGFCIQSDTIISMYFLILTQGISIKTTYDFTKIYENPYFIY